MQSRCFIFSWYAWWIVILLLMRIICSFIFLLHLNISDLCLFLLFLFYHLMINTHQNNRTPLISSIFHFRSVKKWDGSLTIGQNVAHSQRQAYSLHYPFSFIPLSTCSAEQCSAGGQGGGSWQDSVIWWHTKAVVSKIPLCSGTCVTAQPRLRPFLWSLYGSVPLRL